MIGFTKLLSGKATVSEVIRNQGKRPDLLQFSSLNSPLVVWNLTNRCNLNCRHCYISAEDRDYRQELDTQEAKRLIKSLLEVKIPALLFSGGEPLMRKDIFDLAGLALEGGLRLILSSNGTLITKELARKLKRAGFSYVGVSIDGDKPTHDNFRGIRGSFEQALRGIVNCLEAGLKTGIRFTITKLNAGVLPKVLDLAINEKIPRFCLYHLVYAGRAHTLRENDLDNISRIKLADFLIEKSLQFEKESKDIELLTTDNHADGIYLYHYIRKNNPPRAPEVLELLSRQGGCSAGCKIANISPQGYVRPCQFWLDDNLGNIRVKDFKDIWQEADNGLLKCLRKKNEYLKGRCSRCAYNELCGGCRIRAKAVFGDIWQEDPACYLTEDEILTRFPEVA